MLIGTRSSVGRKCAHVGVGIVATQLCKEKKQNKEDERQTGNKAF